MEWMQMYPQHVQPTLADFSQYIQGEAALRWEGLLAQMQAQYGVKPKMTYSTCSGKPGWNIKLQKAGVNFGTLYPDEGGFTVFLVVAYAMQPQLEGVWEGLSQTMRERIGAAGDFMKAGRWMMYPLTDDQDVTDFMAIAQGKWAHKLYKAAQGK